MRHFVMHVPSAAASTDQTAALDDTTDLAARAEIAFHKRQELQEIGWRTAETFVLDDYLADFRADFHDIRSDAAFAARLTSELRRVTDARATTTGRRLGRSY